MPKYKNSHPSNFLLWPLPFQDLFCHTLCSDLTVAITSVIFVSLSEYHVCVWVSEYLLCILQSKGLVQWLAVSRRFLPWSKLIIPGWNLEHALCLEAGVWVCMAYMCCFLPCPLGITKLSLAVFRLCFLGLLALSGFKPWVLHFAFSMCYSRTLLELDRLLACAAGVFTPGLDWLQASPWVWI